MTKTPRILLVVNQDWFFLSHRLPLARAARDAGAEVVVVAGDSGKAPAIRREGFEFVPMPISRQGLNPVKDFQTLRFLRRTYRQLQPDLVHHVTIKPVLYGSIASRQNARMAVVNAISGLGYVFASSDVRAKALRPFVRAFYRQALSHPRSTTLFQNPDDLKDFVRMGLVAESRAVLIRGSGVNCATFQPVAEPTGRPIVLLACRMLWDKGVKEFVEAARLIKGEDESPRFVLVGEPDFGNPGAIPVAQMEAWSRDGAVEWWGRRDDMPVVLAQTSVVILPTTYGEGVPKILLEAAAAGRPIVATDVRGCREIVRPGVNGMLVAPGNGAQLAQAVRALLASRDVRTQFGRAGREIAVAEFAEELVVTKTLGVYRDLLGARAMSQ